jgi:hypothetical protein
MSWTKLDDRFWAHRKVIALDDNLAAIGLWALALSWVGGQLTDGFIPGSAIARLTGRGDAEALARTLVAVGLWEKVDGGYRIHDFLDYNPNRETVEERRKADRDRHIRSRHGVTPAVSHDGSHVPPVPVPVLTTRTRTNGMTHAMTRTPEPVPMPPRPEP